MRLTNIELFFDLVFVFAVAQLSHSLLNDLSLTGTIHVSLFVLAHPAGRPTLDAIAVILGGPAIYIAGNALFKRAICGWLPLSHLAGLGMFLLPVPATPMLTSLTLGAATTAILAVTAAWEWNSLRREPA